MMGSTKLWFAKNYQAFARWKGFNFELPKVQNSDPAIPFIPLEGELDALIAASGKKLSAFLLLLKETGARCGELWRLQWIDLDTEAGTVNIRPEKGSHSRQVKLSPRLLAKLNALSKPGPHLFGKSLLESMRTNLQYSRKRLAEKLQNPRILRIHFHSFRHWKATSTYHRTKDLLFTQKVLGHRDIKSTLVYTHLVNWENPDDYHCKTAKTIPEATELVEAGFEYVTELDGVKLFRKRK